MVGLFCFDGPLYKDKNGVYCNVTLTNEMFNRYFCVVDELIIVVRTVVTDKTFSEMNMNALYVGNLKVIEVNNFNTIKGFLFEQHHFKKNIEAVLEKVDLIFARMPSTTSNAVLEVATKLNKAYFVEVGGCAWDSYWNHGIAGKLIAPLMFWNEKKYIANAKFATYVTEKFLQRRYPNKEVTTNCSNVYLKKTNENLLHQRIKKIEAMVTHSIILGQAVNSIDVKYKGEHFVIRAMKELKVLGIIAELQVVGPGIGTFLIKEAKKYGVLEQVTLIGTLTKDEIFDWYKTIDIYIQPSKQEGLPRSVIEAMSTACPSLGSNIAGIPELLPSNCLFNPNHINEIVSAVMEISQKDKMMEEAKRNFEIANKYNLTDIENRRKDIFEQYKKYVEDKKGLSNNMSIIELKTKLQKTNWGRLIIKAYHYCCAVPMSKLYLLKYHLMKNQSTFKKLSKTRFYTDEEVFLALREQRKSLCRFGDGEITWICQDSKGYFGQENSEELSKRLKQILTSSDETVLIGIPKFFDDMKDYSPVRRNARSIHLAKYGEKWMGLTCSDNAVYADALITRIYFGRNNIDYSKMFSNWQQVWACRKVAIIEGSATLFGVGNDLLDNAASVERIIAPAENAFSKYNEILSCAKRLSKDTLVLIALGPTATILAYDLAMIGYQTIDIGHLDVEYEWFKSGIKSTKQTPVKGKYVNEAGGMPRDTLDEDTKLKYQNEIIYRWEK